MTARSRAAATASLMGAVWGCGASNEPGAALIAVSPPMAYNDTTSALLIEGGPFRPAYRFDTMAGDTTTEIAAFSALLTPVPGGAAAGTDPIPLGDVSWLSIGALRATLPAGIPAGTYDVDVVDPRGQRTSLKGAFLSLGPDQDQPTVTIQAPRPRALIGAATTVTVTLAADDGAGVLASVTAMITTATTMQEIHCTVPDGTPTTVCHIQLTAPAPSGDDDMLVIVARATDSVGLEGGAETRFRLAAAPTLTGLTPAEGPAIGGTAIDIHGTNFVAPTDASEGSQILLDGLPIDPSSMMLVVQSPTEITAVTPPHDEGFPPLTVANGDAAASAYYFHFVPAPIVKGVTPNYGPTSGGIKVIVSGSHFRDGLTDVTIGGRPLESPSFVSANRIEGLLPPGDAGSAVVIATDTIGGDGALFDGFTYDALAAGAPAGQPGPDEQILSAGAP